MHHIATQLIFNQVGHRLHVVSGYFWVWETTALLVQHVPSVWTGRRERLPLYGAWNKMSLKVTGGLLFPQSLLTLAPCLSAAVRANGHHFKQLELIIGWVLSTEYWVCDRMLSLFSLYITTVQLVRVTVILHTSGLSDVTGIVVLSWRLRGTSRDGQHSGWVGDDEAVSMATWSWLERWHQFAAADRYQNAVDCQRWIYLQSLSLAALDWQMCQCHSLSPSCLYSVSVFSVFGNVVNAILLSTADEMLSGGHLMRCTGLRIWSLSAWKWTDQDDCMW